MNGENCFSITRVPRLIAPKLECPRMHVTFIMFKSTLLYTCLLFYVVHVQSMPMSMFGGKRTVEMARGVNDWRDTLSDDTRHRLDLAKQHLQDQSTSGQAFRNDTIMR